MISQEAPVLFAKACEIFIRELTLRAWLQTEENKRKTLQRNDIAAAISKTDTFDFLIDIVPREDIKMASKKMEEARGPNADLQQYYYHQALQHQLPERMDMMYYHQQQQLQQQQLQQQQLQQQQLQQQQQYRYFQQTGSYQPTDEQEDQEQEDYQ